MDICPYRYTHILLDPCMYLCMYMYICVCMYVYVCIYFRYWFPVQHSIKRSISSFCNITKLSIMFHRISCLSVFIYHFCQFLSGYNLEECVTWNLLWFKFVSISGLCLPSSQTAGKFTAGKLTFQKVNLKFTSSCHFFRWTIFHR